MQFLERNFLKYSVIFPEGSRGDCAYLLKLGRVEISKMVDGQKKVLAVLKPISLFGEMAVLLGDDKRTATAMALDDVKAVEIKRAEFEKAVAASPPIVTTVVKVLVHRLKTATQRSMRVPGAFTGTTGILGLMASSGSTSIEYRKFVAEVCKTIMVTPEEVDKVMQSLVRDKMVSISGEGSERVITILETDNFAGVAAVKHQKAMENY